jgi:hypothetical protein
LRAGLPSLQYIERLEGAKIHFPSVSGTHLNLAGGVRTDRGLSGNRLRWTWNVVEEMLIMGGLGLFVFVV